MWICSPLNEKMKTWMALFCWFRVRDCIKYITQRLYLIFITPSLQDFLPYKLYDSPLLFVPHTPSIHRYSPLAHFWNVWRCPGPNHPWLIDHQWTLRPEANTGGMNTSSCVYCSQSFQVQLRVQQSNSQGTLTECTRMNATLMGHSPVRNPTFDLLLHFFWNKLIRFDKWKETWALLCSKKWSSWLKLWFLLKLFQAKI